MSRRRVDVSVRLSRDALEDRRSLRLQHGTVHPLEALVGIHANLPR
jgi:hypothetical protein